MTQEQFIRRRYRNLQCQQKVDDFDGEMRHDTQYSNTIINQSDTFLRVDSTGV